MKINGGPWFLLETRRLFYYYSSLTGYNTALDKLLRVIFKAFQVIETPARSLIWMGYLSCHEKLIDPSRTAKYSRIAQFSVAKKTLERRCYSNCRKPWQSSLSYLPKTRSLLADDSQTFEKNSSFIVVENKTYFSCLFTSRVEQFSWKRLSDKYHLDLRISPRENIMFAYCFSIKEMKLSVWHIKSISFLRTRRFSLVTHNLCVKKS